MLSTQERMVILHDLIQGALQNSGFTDITPELEREYLEAIVTDTFGFQMHCESVNFQIYVSGEVKINPNPSISKFFGKYNSNFPEILSARAKEIGNYLIGVMDFVFDYLEELADPGIGLGRFAGPQSPLQAMDGISDYAQGISQVVGHTCR